MKVIFLMILLCASCFAWDNPGSTLPTFRKVMVYSEAYNQGEGTGEITLRGDITVTADADGDGGAVTADRIYASVIEGVTSFIADYIYATSGLSANAITADHTLIGYETVIGGSNVNAVTANKITTGILNSNVIVATTGDFTDISANTITVVTGNFTYLNSDTGEITSFYSDTGEIDSLKSDTIEVRTLLVTDPIDAETSSVYRTCRAGVNITKGQVVYFYPGVSPNPTVGLADNRFWVTSHPVGFAAETKTAGQQIRIITHGSVKGINTSGMTEGEHVYLGPNGTYTQTRPSSGSVQVIGYVAYAHATRGEIIKVLHHESYWGAPLDDPFWFRFGTALEGKPGMLFRDGSSEVVAAISDLGDFTLHSATSEVGYYLGEVSTYDAPVAGYGYFLYRNGKPYFATDTMEYMLAGSGGGGAALTNDVIGIDKYFKLSEVDRTTVPTPGTGEVNIFMDNILHAPAQKDWLGKVYGFVLESIEDIPFLFNTGTYTDYTYTGTYSVNWNASLSSIFNVDDLSNPSATPYNLTLQTKVPRLVDISSITPSGFSVEYGPYDTGNILFGSVGNSSVLYGLGSDPDNNYDCTQDSSTDFLESNWTNNDATNVSLSATTVTINNAGIAGKYVRSTSAITNTDFSIISKFEYGGAITENIGVGLYMLTDTNPFYGDGNNMVGISYNNNGGNLTVYAKYSSSLTAMVAALSADVWTKVMIYNFNGTSCDAKFWYSSSELGYDDDWGDADATYTSISISSGTYYIGVGATSGQQGIISNVYYNSIHKDTTGTWQNKIVINGDATDWLNIESVVNSKMSIFKSDTSSTVYGPYIYMPSGDTCEIESINISY